MQTFATTRVWKANGKDDENVLLTLASIRSARKWGYKVPEVALSDLSCLEGESTTSVLLGRRNGTDCFVRR
jgi:hypothetical protein